MNDIIWITYRGRHIPIKPGMKGKFKKEDLQKAKKIEKDYKMEHRPDTEWNMTPDDLLGENSVAPKDIYEHPEYYLVNGNNKVLEETKKALQNVKGKPNEMITIYRATPGNEINHGDWVTLSKSYAEDHNYSQLDGKGNILEKKVPVKDVQWAGDDLAEWGYFPKKENNYNINNDHNKLNEIADNYENIDKYKDLDDISKDYIKNRRREMANEEFTRNAHEIHEKTLKQAIKNEEGSDIKHYSKDKEGNTFIEHAKLLDDYQKGKMKTPDYFIGVEKLYGGKNLSLSEYEQYFLELGYSKATALKYAKEIINKRKGK